MEVTAQRLWRVHVLDPPPQPGSTVCLLCLQVTATVELRVASDGVTFNKFGEATNGNPIPSKVNVPRLIGALGLRVVHSSVIAWGRHSVSTHRG